jgi:outer membrane protein TolC
MKLLAGKLLRTVVFVLIGAAIVCGGCTRNVYKRSADEDAYSVIKEKSGLVPGMPESFTIERDTKFDTLIAKDQSNTEAMAGTVVVLTLEKALEIAVDNNRDFQKQKEALFVTALDLTQRRYEFGFRLNNEFGAEWVGEDAGDQLTGRGSLGVSRMMKTGTKIAANISTNFVKMLTGERDFSITSLLTVSILQPLFEGSAVASTESLTQAERDLVYQIRSFTRLRRSFSVRIASSYFRILQRQRTLKNEENNYTRVQMAKAETEKRVKLDELPIFELDEAKLKELEARNRKIRVEKDYNDQLDQFKIELGMTTDMAMIVPETEIEKLSERGIVPPPINGEDVIPLALANRLDIKTAADRVEDTFRKIDVAADALEMKLDLTAGYNVESEDTSSGIDFNFGDGQLSVGAVLSLPLDKLPQRNSFRKAVIAHQESTRNYTKSVDDVKLQVRKAWRTLDQASETYEIQKMSRDLARRRIMKARMSLEARTRDVLEANDALLDAENNLTEALIDHTVARLELLRDIELLEVDDKGIWKEAPPAKNDSTGKTSTGGN